MSSSDRKKILILLICMVTGSAVGVFITTLSMSLLIDIYRRRYKVRHAYI